MREMMTGSVQNRLNKALAQRILPLCLCGFVGFALLTGMPQASAQSSNDVMNRLKRVENDLDTLNRAVYKGEKPPALSSGQDEAANLEVRLGQIETDMRNLTGKFEQQSYDTQQLQQKLDALSQDTKMRLDTIEAQQRNGGTPPPSAIPQTPPIGATPGAAAPGTLGSGLTPSDQQLPDVLKPDPAAQADSSVVSGSETGATDAAGLYEQGFGAIKKEDYAGAEKSFAAFMKQYPDHSLAPNALYWLGETYYARKMYDKAALTFAEAYKKYPGGPKGADNLLKLGMSLAGKGEKDNACIALGQLKKEYPKGPAPVLTRGDQEMATLGCK